MSPPSISSTTPAPSPLRCSPHVRTLLRRLHDLSTLQEVNIPDDEWTIVRDRAKTDPTGSTKAVDELMIDKFIALDEDKAMFVYNLILATGATTVVEAGTSFGVSTMYLALAVGQNCANMGENDAEGASEGNSGETKREIVIGTEKEESKAQIARKHWQEAGPEIQKWIDLRVGDLNETLSGDMGLEKGQQVDFLLLDIWAYVALPALNLVQPHLRPGAVVVCDNVISSAEGYADLLKVLRDPKGPFRSVTLPFKGGLEMSVYCP